MTVENEQTKTVSNKQLLVDIDNTTKEESAYLKLYEGYLILSRLPENIECGRSKEEISKANEYLTLWGECDNFLNKLNALKKERGLF